MLSISLELQTNGNSAFEGAEACRAEVARILTDVTNNLLEPGRYKPNEDYPLRDINGNRCGHIWLNDEDEDEN